jgi:tRNA modification GTPase
LREAGDAIEDEGIRRAKRRAADADLKIAVFDGALYPARDAETASMVDADTLAVINKADLIATREAEGGLQFVSATTGLGLEAFAAALLQRVRSKADTGGIVPLTRARHRKALEECRDALLRARTAALPELAAEDLRLAARSLGRLTGRLDVEEILDVVFRDFCIGK